MRVSKQKLIRILAGASAGLIFGGTLGFLLGGVFGGMGILFNQIFVNDFRFLILRMILGIAVGMITGASISAISKKTFSSNEKANAGALIGVILGILVGIKYGEPIPAPLAGIDIIFLAGTIGLTAGGLTGLVSAIYMTAKSQDNIEISADEKKRNEEYSLYMKQRLNRKE